RRFRRWGRWAEDLDDSLFLVGGCVRDLLMDVPTRDFDFVVEEDGIRFARKIIEEEGGHMSSHDKFKTAVITLPDGEKVDVATARTEYYTHPAALPEVEVEHTSVAQDL
ncbi:MAG: polya polymerase, partial [bacterium]